MKILTKILHYNFILIEKRKSKGITQQDMANYIGVSTVLLSKIETLQDVSHTRNINNILENIADFLETPFDVMFPPEYIDVLFSGRLKYHKQYLHKENLRLLNSGCIKKLEEGDLINVIENKQNFDEFRKYIELLPKREKEVIDLRFGLSGEELTLEETGRRLKVNRERVRQMEARAIKRMRRPSINKKLHELFENYTRNHDDTSK